MIKHKIIEDYLFDELSGQKKIDFESKLIADKELQEEYVISENINKAILEQDVMQLRSTIQTLTNKNEYKRKRKLQRVIFWPMAAAVISLMVIIYFFATRINKTADPQILFAEYYQTYPTVAVLRNEGDLIVPDLIYYNAFLYYENRQFEEAIQLFEEIKNGNSAEIMAIFYLALSQIEVGNFISAKQNLLILTQKNDHLFYEQSLWYLALANLKLENTTDAKKILKEIVLNNHYNAIQAKSLLKKLNKKRLTIIF
ncbi:MAG: tol-pal system YbgF family protein [Bacteroidales bacterium]